MPRTAESIAKQKETLAANRQRDEDKNKRREERKALRTTGIRTQIAQAGPVDAFPHRTAVMQIDVDWQFLPMGEAQQFYARLKDALEKAGSILNARSMPEGEFYLCYMAGRPKCCDKGRLYRRPAKFRDYENGPADPKTGLVIPVEICGENCSIRYNDILIQARRERHMIPRTS